MKKLILIFIVLLNCYAFAQKKYFKGVVLNSSDSIPLPFVNIYNDLYKFGTVTNELGQYILNYPDSISKFKVSFSSLGFLTKNIDINSIPETLYLSPSDIMLDEVIINNKNTNISFVLDKVYKNIKNNYSNKRHLLKAFYRQVSIKKLDSNYSYTRIIEADVGIQEYGILKQLDRDRIKIYQYRKSDDKITKKWYRVVARKMFGGEPNRLFWLKKMDFIKNFVKYKNYKTHYKNILDNYNFEFVDYTSINNHLVAIYTYYEKKFSNLNILDAHKNKLYINLDDYAIVKVINTILLGNKNTYHVIGKPNTYTYTKIGDYYYLNNVINNMLLLSKKNEKEYQINQLYVYQVETKRKDYKKIKRKEKEKIMGDVYEKDVKLDTTFWSNYKILPTIPLKEKLKYFLEKNKSLEKQFLDNGNKI